MKTKYCREFAVMAMLLLVSSLAQATPMDSAKSHINAITSGNVAEIMKDYDANAAFQWVGGPLDGVYNGTGNIEQVWTKFVNKVAPKQAEVVSLEENANPKGSTVSANVVFHAKKPIKVRYVMVFRNDKLVNEVWQIDPKMEAGSY